MKWNEFKHVFFCLLCAQLFLGKATTAHILMSYSIFSYNSDSFVFFCFATCRLNWISYAVEHDYCYTCIKKELNKPSCVFTYVNFPCSLFSLTHIFLSKKIIIRWTSPFSSSFFLLWWRECRWWRFFQNFYLPFSHTPLYSHALFKSLSEQQSIQRECI